MSFLAPKPPKVAPAPNAAANPLIARDSTDPSLTPSFTGYNSLISTSSSGLGRKAFTQKVSLIGGGG